MNIRSTKIEDFEEVLSLFYQLWPNKKINKNELKKVFERGIASQFDEYISVEIEGRVIGFCAYGIMNNFWQEGYIGYIYTMIVDEKYRRKGIGKTLIEFACTKAKSFGCKKVELDSGFQREDAHLFYENNRFDKRAFLFSRDL
jgi:Acetyltransferases